MMNTCTLDLQYTNGEKVELIVQYTKTSFLIDIRVLGTVVVKGGGNESFPCGGSHGECHSPHNPPPLTELASEKHQRQVRLILPTFLLQPGMRRVSLGAHGEQDKLVTGAR